VQVPPVPLRPRSKIVLKADAQSAQNKTRGDEVAAFVKSNFPGVKVKSVNPTTGYVTVDLTGVDARTKRMLRDGAPNAYYLYDEPGKPVVLQVTGSPNPVGNRRRQ
jgi:hypothetical protein